jgi:hypothetical protein
LTGSIVKDLDKLNLLKLGDGGKFLSSNQFYVTVPAASKMIVASKVVKSD